MKTVTENTVNGTTRTALFPSETEASAFLQEKARSIETGSSGKKYSYKVTSITKKSLTVGVIGGNPEAIRYTIK